MLPIQTAPRFAFPTSSAFRRDVDNLFNQFLSKANAGDTRNDNVVSGWSAPVSIWDDEEHVYVELDVPGLSRDDLEILLHGGKLRIAGERKAAPESRTYWHNERPLGRFERLIRLPDMIEAESVNATLRDGVLLVTLMKRPDARPMKVCINAE